MKSALALALVLGTVSLQATERLMLKWSELDAVIVGKKITTILPDGRKMEAAGQCHLRRLYLAATRTAAPPTA
jgi:hypothetical protein